MTVVVEGGRGVGKEVRKSTLLLGAPCMESISIFHDIDRLKDGR